jgi:hypothetical protein
VQPGGSIYLDTSGGVCLNTCARCCTELISIRYGQEYDGFYVTTEEEQWRNFECASAQLGTVTASSVTCTTSSFSRGINLQIGIAVQPHPPIISSTSRLYFPNPQPRVLAVQGCASHDGATTSGCLTQGGQNITVCGVGFFPGFGIRLPVLRISGLSCTNAQVWDYTKWNHTLSPYFSGCNSTGWLDPLSNSWYGRQSYSVITCQTPPSVGLSAYVDSIFDSSTGPTISSVTSQGGAYLSYAPPSVTGVCLFRKPSLHIRVCVVCLIVSAVDSRIDIGL